MINIKLIEQYCCEDISLIENYEEAVNSPEKYDCHHRLEIQGNKVISVDELKEKNLYFKRPADELVFLNHIEHTKLHKPSQYRMKRKIKFGEEYKERCRQNMLGRRWYTDGVHNIQTKECPEGYYLGRSFVPSDNFSSKGFHWYTNGITNVQAKKCPENFYPGRTVGRCSEETKQKMSLAQRGENNHFYGKHHSEEAKRKMSLAGISRKQSEETKRKKSESLKGRVFTDDTKKKISLAKKGKKGKSPSEETRKKLSEALKGKPKGKGRHYYNNGIINVLRKQCPEGFVEGRINNWGEIK